MKDRPSDGALEEMRKHGGTWAAYQNVCMDSSGFGHLQFLRVGEDCTYEVAPEQLPDTPKQINWRYQMIGFVDLDSGEINIA